MTFYGFVNTIITMIPVVDQAADIRDIAAGIKVLAWDRKYNDYMVWIGICFTIIGLFPTAGSLAKGVLKCVFKSLPIARIAKVFNGLAEGNVVRYLKMLGDGGLDALHRQTLEQFNKLVAAVRGKLNRIKALVPDRLKDAHASLNRFIDGLDQAKRHAPDMIARFFDDLWQKLENILGGPRLDNAMSGPTNATLIRKQTRADAPKLEMAGGNRSINKATKVASKQGLKVPGRVQSRINIKTGSVSEGTGWEHVLHEHFNPAKNKSQFTVSKNELRSILQSEKVVQTPVCRTLESSDGIRYVREVDLGRPIGLDKYSHNQPTSVMTVLTDEYGNLVTATPGVIN